MDRVLEVHAEDMDAVWDAIRAHRDLALKYWTSGAELMSLLAEEEIHVTEGWSGRIYALQEQGHDIGYYDPPNGYGWQECLFVLKGSPMEARAGDAGAPVDGASVGGRAVGEPRVHARRA